MLTLDDAREWLRYEPGETYMDAILQGLLDAIPHYIEATTGMTPAQQQTEPLADMVGKFLLLQWFDNQYRDTGNLQTGIDNMLKALALKVQHAE